jgi:hypothetical protein
MIITFVDSNTAKIVEYSNGINRPMVFEDMLLGYVAQSKPSHGST